MAAPSKQTSRWGSFLQQAVAGVESRLDNILAEGIENEAVKSTKLANVTSTPGAAAKAESGVSRTASTSSRTNDRLQERLARAIATKNTAQKGEGSRPDSLALTSTPPTRTGSPITGDSPRTSTDVGSPGLEDKDAEQPPATDDTVSTVPNQRQGDVPSIEVQPGTPSAQKTLESQEGLNGLAAKDVEAAPRLSTESTRSSIPRNSIDSTRLGTGLRSSTDAQSGDLTDAVVSALKTPIEYEALLKQLQSDFETSELQRQEEVHGYIERIDALQSKLQYLAKESAEAARKASGSAAGGSLEKKLADKEEQVALLMEEGQQLSKKELTHLTTIKKLRAKIQEDSKEIAEAKRKQEKAEKDIAVVTARWKKAESSEKRLNEKQKQVIQLQKDVDTLKAEEDAKDSTIADLKAQLEEAVAQGKQAETKLVTESLEAEKKRVADLEDDLANLKIEKSLVSDRAQAQIKELREKMDKDAERARIVALEAKTEQQMLESKLEVMRARAEEVSSGATGDAQAKLLRQIETLQTQYAVASENWQGIEASLIARATNLEKERDEATRREADIRRKAREVTLKAKRNEDELEETRSQLPSFQQELSEHKSKLQSLQKQREEAESALKEAKATFDQEKQTWKAEMQQCLDEERQKWQEETSSLGHSRAESPVASPRRGLTSEFLGLQNLQIRRASARSMHSEVATPMSFVGRRPSTQPLARSSGNGTPTRQDSIQSLKENGESTDAPSIHTDHDDFFENQQSPNSPHQTINDMVSVSTAGVGPTVQLVERMSSAVRRLESEKVATKEDITRLSAQRDEARAEIVALMREVEAKRAADTKVAELEADIKDINQRYQTTLEMLGEKSELVDELQSDIVDLKAMYRELVERTVK